MNESDLKQRTKQFGLHMMRLVDALPNTVSGRAIANQLVRSGTAVGANYRAACRARSPAEFVAKLGVVVEEADECAYWLELIAEGGLLSLDQLKPLLNEADELTAMMVASIRTAQSNQKSQIKNQK